MKQILGLGFDQGIVIFTPGGAGVGTVVFSDMVAFKPARLLAITNITKKMLIYAAEKTGKAGAWSAVSMFGGTLTLEMSTTGHSSGDILRVQYEDDYHQWFESYGPRECFLDGLYSGQRFYYDGAWPAVRTAVGILNPIGGTQMPFYESIIVSASRPCDIQVSWTNDSLYGINAWPTTGDIYRGYLNGSLIIPFNRFIYPHNRLQVWTEFGDGAPIHITGSVLGYAVASDMHFNARKSMIWIGDSISKGSGGGDYIGPQGHHAFIAKDHLCNLGYDYRMILKAEGGKTTADSEVWRTQQGLTVARPRQVGVIVYNMGANDWPAPATALTNLGLFVPWARKIYPQATIIVMGPSPAQDNTSEAGIATIRTNYQGYVAGLADPRVLYCNLGTAFDRTDFATNYSSADTPGYGIHPSAAGYAALGALVSAFLDANLGTIP
jgi:lysophospholipase L1-like esterase